MHLQLEDSPAMSEPASLLGRHLCSAESFRLVANRENFCSSRSQRLCRAGPAKSRRKPARHLDLLIQDPGRHGVARIPMCAPMLPLGSCHTALGQRILFVSGHLVARSQQGASCSPGIASQDLECAVPFWLWFSGSCVLPILCVDPCGCGQTGTTIRSSWDASTSSNTTRP